ncbi:hypothetical protein AVEN_157090-1 [Araneus ventricosus]|uniref:Uncharacterized protein n=1 Tax=Araneus ventricosus TaxID=182803 RepID=A0A4Y2FTK9_ARAVE|nr:hypothetical protein AVEN_157090-1 [Araneus ventricosus]
MPTLKGLEISSWITICLVLMSPRFDAKQGLFSNGTCNIEPGSYDEKDTRVGTLLFKLPHHTNWRTFDPLRVIEHATVLLKRCIFSEIASHPEPKRPGSRDVTSRPPRFRYSRHTAYYTCALYDQKVGKFRF